MEGVEGFSKTAVPLLLGSKAPMPLLLHPMANTIQMILIFPKEPLLRDIHLTDIPTLPMETMFILLPTGVGKVEE